MEFPRRPTPMFIQDSRFFRRGAEGEDSRRCSVPLCVVVRKRKRLSRAVVFSQTNAWRRSFDKRRHSEKRQGTLPAWHVGSRVLQAAEERRRRTPHRK